MAESNEQERAKPNEQKLTIRIPARIWNAYVLPTPAPSSESSPLFLAVTFPESPDSPPTSPPPSPTQCNIRLSRFQYGGPKVRRRGPKRNEITLEQPCLLSTCKCCWKWYPHLMRGEQEVKKDGEGDGGNEVEEEEGGERKEGDNQGESKERDNQSGRTERDGSMHGGRRVHRYGAHDSDDSGDWHLSRVFRREYRKKKVRLAFESSDGKERFKKLVMRQERESEVEKWKADRLYRRERAG